MEKTKIIFDADMAVYDSFALSILLNNPSLEILAVTVCRGNVEVFQAAKNAVRLLREWNRLDVRFIFKYDNKSFVSEAFIGFNLKETKRNFLFRTKVFENIYFHNLT